MEKKTSKVPVKVQLIKAKSTVPLLKAETTTAISSKEADSVGDWIYPEYNMYGLKALVKNSTILPQCIRAYKNNISARFFQSEKFIKIHSGGIQNEQRKSCISIFRRS